MKLYRISMADATALSVLIQIEKKRRKMLYKKFFKGKLSKRATKLALSVI